MAAKKLLGSLSYSCRLPAASTSLPASVWRRTLASQAVPAGSLAGESAGGVEVANYKNMHDSLLEIYNANAGTAVSDKGGAMSVTRFMNVSAREKSVQLPVVLMCYDNMALQDILATGLRRDDPRLTSTLGKLQAGADFGLLSQPAFME